MSNHLTWSPLNINWVEGEVEKSPAWAIVILGRQTGSMAKPSPGAWVLRCWDRFSSSFRMIFSASESQGNGQLDFQLH